MEMLPRTNEKNVPLRSIELDVTLRTTKMKMLLRGIETNVQSRSVGMDVPLKGVEADMVLKSIEVDVSKRCIDKDVSQSSIERNILLTIVHYSGMFRGQTNEEKLEIMQNNNLYQNITHTTSCDLIRKAKVAWFYIKLNFN